MANETATLNWVRDDITSATVVSPATAITTAVALPQDRASIPVDGSTPWIGVWREPDFHSYTRSNMARGYYDEMWRLGLFVFFQYENPDIYGLEGLAMAEIGYAWRDTLINWISTNETLGDNAWGIGDNESQFYIDPFTPSPPWLQQQGWGTYMVIPIQTPRGPA